MDQVDAEVVGASTDDEDQKFYSENTSSSSEESEFLDSDPDSDMDNEPVPSVVGESYAPQITINDLSSVKQVVNLSKILLNSIGRNSQVFVKPPTRTQGTQTDELHSLKGLSSKSKTSDRNVFDIPNVFRSILHRAPKSYVPTQPSKVAVHRVISKLHAELADVEVTTKLTEILYDFLHVFTKFYYFSCSK